MAASISLDSLKSLLVDAINSTGGIEQEEDVIEIPKLKYDDDIEDDIEVPKSEFEDDIEVPKSEYDDMLIEEDKVEGKKVNIEEVVIAVPRDKKLPYENQWIIVDEDSLSKLKFNDYDILAFGVGDERLFIVEATFEEA